MMTTEELRAARREMEREICNEVSIAVERFRARTGMCPRGINIDLVEVTRMGDRERTFVVNEVRANVEL